MEKIILSFDVGVIHLSYCMMTKKLFTKADGTTYMDWYIIDWNNIDLTDRDEMKCSCGKKASLTNTVNGVTNYYCKPHAKKIEIVTKPFEECFTAIQNNSVCITCGKNAKYNDTTNNYCTTHAKAKHKTTTKSNDLKSFKIKSSRTLNFDDVKYNLMMVLESKPNLLAADYVVIENQPSFKNPRMKSIASTIYDYYLIRGIIDKNITKSNISQVKFMSPSNKLKLANEGDTKQLIKVKKESVEEGKDTKAYKLTKSLGIKYCNDMITHLPDWTKHFNSFKKKDDMADSFLQGAYFYTSLEPVPKQPRKQTEKQLKESLTEPTAKKRVKKQVNEIIV
jgi:hypothetical protein